MDNPSHHAASNDPDSALVDNLSCTRCGYSLYTLDADAHCPECGCPIRVTIQRFHERANPWWRWHREDTRWVLTFLLLFGLPIAVVIINTGGVIEGGHSPILQTRRTLDTLEQVLTEHEAKTGQRITATGDLNNTRRVLAQCCQDPDIVNMLQGLGDDFDFESHTAFDGWGKPILLVGGDGGGQPNRDTRFPRLGRGAYFVSPGPDGRFGDVSGNAEEQAVERDNVYVD